MKPPILDDDERRAAISLACKGNKEVCGGEIIATAQRDFDYEHEKQTVREIFEEIICPMCYRLNPQHAPSGDYKGCHSCQEKEKWCGQSRVEKEVFSGHQS